nr:unnamed protein product [Digitaria exilis]
MTLSIGTPALLYLAIVDTGSYLIWTQCAPCSGDDQSFQQLTPLYSPANSTTFTDLPCDSPLSKSAYARRPRCQEACTPQLQLHGSDTDGTGGFVIDSVCPARRSHRGGVRGDYDASGDRQLG